MLGTAVPRNIHIQQSCPTFFCLSSKWKKKFKNCEFDPKSTNKWIKKLKIFHGNLARKPLAKSNIVLIIQFVIHDSFIYLFTLETDTDLSSSAKNRRQSLPSNFNSSLKSQVRNVKLDKLHLSCQILFFVNGFKLFNFVENTEAISLIQIS